MVGYELSPPISLILTDPLPIPPVPPHSPHRDPQGGPGACWHWWWRETVSRRGLVSWKEGWWRWQGKIIRLFLCAGVLVLFPRLHVYFYTNTYIFMILEERFNFKKKKTKNQIGLREGWTNCWGLYSARYPEQGLGVRSWEEGHRGFPGVAQGVALLGHWSSHQCQRG